MGWNTPQWKFFQKCLADLDTDIAGKQMLELGNQRIKDALRKKLGLKIVIAGKFFRSRGAKYTCIDMNGKDKALPIDLSKSIEDETLMGKFDIITNSGTTEHVEPFKSQYRCFRNIHNMAAIGCIFVHMVPASGFYSGHCQQFYHHDFFDKLAELNGYRMVRRKILKKKTGELVYACMVKQDDRPFTKEKAELLSRIDRVEYTKAQKKYFKKEKNFRTLYMK